MKVSYNCIMTAIVLIWGQDAYSSDRLFVNGLSNATPGTTVLAVDWDTKKYYTWSTDKQRTEVPVLDVDGKKVVAVTVDHEITNARMDFWGGYDWGEAQEFQLNFKHNLSLNGNTSILNSYGALYANDGHFDLTLNFETGRNFTAFAKSGEFGEGGIVNGDKHHGDLNINGGTLSIYTVKQDKSDCTDTLHALYNEGNGAININNESVLIQQKDSDADWIYGITNLRSGGINIITKSLTIENAPDSTNQKNMYSAIYSQGGSKPISITSDVVSIHDAKYPVYASGGSIVINAKEAYINAAYGTHDDVAINDWSIFSTKNGSVVINESGNHRLNTAGYMNADGGSIALRAGSDSIMQHRAVVENKGTFNMTLLDRAVWHMPHNNTLTNLVFEDGGSVDFNHEFNFTQDAPNYKNLTTTSLSGKGGTLGLRIDMAKDSDTVLANDQIIVSGAATGEHKVTIDFVNGLSSIPEGKTHSANWLLNQGAGSDLKLTNIDGGNDFSGRGMVTTWGLAFVANGEEDKLDTAEGLAQLVGNTTGKGEGKWYLVRNDEEIVDPSPDPKPEQPGPNAPTEIQQITNMGISATQALSFAAEIDDLRTRLGEVRYGAQDGAWVKAGYAKEHADGYNGRGFSQKTHDLHIGLDRLVAQQEDRSWLVGGALRYAKSDQEGFAAALGGTGELEQYSAKLYATYMHEKGSYADFVLQAGRYAQDLSGLANDKVSAFSADYKTWGYGASVEVGHMFSFGNDVDDRRWTNHAFVEPQLQLSYFRANGKDYTTSTGMAVSQSDADFLMGRAGVVVGKKFNYGSANDLDKRYFQIALKGGVKYEFKGDQTIGFTGVEGVTKHFKADEMDGARYYYGLTTDWQLGDNLRAYATIEREEGDHYTKDIDATVGLKYAF